MSPQTVRTERDGRVLTVRLDNPPRNFMTGAMVAELDALTRSLADDDSVGAVVLTGAPDDIFITHFDVEEILAGSEGVGGSLSATLAGGALKTVGALERIPGARGGIIEHTPAAGLLALRDIHELFLRMNRLDKVFIAAVNGLALGGGCELALACDLRLMAEGDHRIGLPEVTVGIIPGAGGTQRLARALGPAQALELMLEGRPLRPQEALEAGLVHHVFPSERLLDEAHTIAQRMARRSPAAVAALKRAVYEGASRGLAEGLHIERAEFLSAASTAAARRGMEAYAEQVRRLGDAAPWQDDSLIEPWREGTAVDMTS
jgi:enoyl-CoA hydratase